MDKNGNGAVKWFHLWIVIIGIVGTATTLSVYVLGSTSAALASIEREARDRDASILVVVNEQNKEVLQRLSRIEAKIDK